MLNIKAYTLPEFPPEPISKAQAKMGNLELGDILKTHDCILVQEGDLWKIAFPDGTTWQEIFPRITHPAMRVYLPDGYQFMMISQRGEYYVACRLQTF